MADEKPFTPPTRKPVSEFPTPDHSVSFYTELVNRDDPAYKANAPMKRGALYSTIVGAKQEVIAQFPQLFFLRERKFQLSDQLVLWDWATDEQAHDTYNSTDTYVANNVNYPAFTRTYTIRRELYEAQKTLPIGSPLAGIIAVTITSPGAGYTQARGVIDGTNVAVSFTLSPEGGLLTGIITNTDSDGTTSVADGTAITIIGDGVNAEAVAVIQPTNCVLTAQTKEELPDADPLQHELVKVTRVYETLPGPFIYTTRHDKDGALITTGVRRNITANITDGDEITPQGQWVQVWHKAVDSFISEETIESRSVPGNPISSTKVEDDGKILTTVRQLIDTNTGVSSESITGGNWVREFVTEVDDSSLVKVHQASTKVSYQVTESRSLPGNVLTETKLDEAGNEILITKQMMAAADVITSEAVNGSHLWIKKYGTPISDLVSWQIEEQLQLPGKVQTTEKLDDAGNVITITKRLQELSLITPSETVNGSNAWIKRTAEAVSDLVAYEVVEALQLPGKVETSTKVDEDGISIFTTKRLEELSNISTSESIIGGNWIRKYAEAVSDLVAYEVEEQRAVPGNPIVEDKIDDDGKAIDSVRTLKDRTTITPSESVVAGVWIKTESKAVSDLVAWEVVTARDVPGNSIPSYVVEKDHQIATITRILKDKTTIVPSATEFGGVITTVDQKEVSDLVSNEITTHKPWLDEAFYEAKIPNVIPEVFRAQIPTLTESHIKVSGSGHPGSVTLGTGEFSRSERALTKLLYEQRVETFDWPGIEVVVTNKGLTEKFGGATTTITLRINTVGTYTIDEGKMVLGSKIDNLGNGYETKITEVGDGDDWPTRLDRHFDIEMQRDVSDTKQVIGVLQSIPPLGDYDVDAIRAIDKWRTEWTRTTRRPQAIDQESAIVSSVFGPYNFPGLLGTTTGFSWTGIPLFTYKRASARLVEHKIRTWWVKSPGRPSISFDKVITDSAIMPTISGGFEWVHDVLHDGYVLGTHFFPPTTPSYTQYVLGNASYGLQAFINLVNPGTNYQVGQQVSFGGGGATGFIRVTSTGVGRSILTFDTISAHVISEGVFGPFGSNATFEIIGVRVPQPGAGAWQYSEKVVAASVEPTNIPFLWKVETKSVVML